MVKIEINFGREAFKGSTKRQMTLGAILQLLHFQKTTVKPWRSSLTVFLAKCNVHSHGFFRTYEQT